MYAKKIKYVDYDGNERVEDFYFNLNKAELIKWLTQAGDYTLDKLMDKMVKEHNAKEIINIFDSLIYMAYGEKSIDGKRFIKSEEVKRNFMESEAYSELFMELVTNAEAASTFVSSVIPKDLNDEVQKIMSENPNALPDYLKDYIPKSE